MLMSNKEPEKKRFNIDKKISTHPIFKFNSDVGISIKPMEHIHNKIQTLFSYRHINLTLFRHLLSLNIFFLHAITHKTYDNKWNTPSSASASAIVCVALHNSRYFFIFFKLWWYHEKSHLC